ncbi:YbaK/prolyl-tRNA synthetase associated domain-containing protein [Klebsiella pneumoniae]|nr:YbaK/prolyl-tRNA synthetase associated domain-containing protein [Klebsiella pneumoniae]
MLEAVEGNIHQRLCALLDEHRARYRVMAHEAVGQCEAVSAIRGTALGQGAKALVCKVKGNGVNQHVLAILAADRQADLASLARHIGGSKASLASQRRWRPSPPACSAFHPFSFHPALRLVADPLLFDAFLKSPLTPGADRSIILDTEDYLHIARPEIATFRRLS